MMRRALLWMAASALAVTPAWGQGATTAPAAPAGEGAKTAPAAAPAPAAEKPAEVPTAVPPAAPAPAPIPAPPAAPVPPAPAPAAPIPVDGSTHSLRLRDLEVGIVELKEQIRRSHTRLSLLSDTVFGADYRGAQVRVSFEDRLGGALEIERLVVLVDGEIQYNEQSDTGAFGTGASSSVFEGVVAPGEHTLQIMMQVRGAGFGVFSYMDKLSKVVERSVPFTAGEGALDTFRVVAWEQGGVTTPVMERPALAVEVHQEQGSGAQ